jgi:hypothetical protein
MIRLLIMFTHGGTGSLGASSFDNSVLQLLVSPFVARVLLRSQKLQSLLELLEGNLTSVEKRVEGRFSTI